MIWNHTPIRAQGGILSLIPIIAVIISFIFALYGNRQRGFLEEDIQRRFRLVRQYNDLLGLMINAETGERGFLLTKRQEFLEPYNLAVEQIPGKISDLTETIQQEPGDKPRTERLASLNEVQNLIERELISLKDSQIYRLDGDKREAIYEHLQTGKSLMDQIRATLGVMEERDGELLNEKISEINSIHRRDYLLLFIVLLVGILMRVVSFYLFDRGIVRRIDRLTEDIALINRGESDIIQPPKKDDAIGLLEQEIVKMAEQRSLIEKVK